MTVFVITGTRRGIGLEYVRQLASDPDNIIVAIVRDLKSDLADLRDVQAQSNQRVRVVECDVSSAASLGELEAKLGATLGEGQQINVIINNAAIQNSGEQTGLTATAEKIHEHIEANVVGPARVLQAALARLAPGAIIAHISSGAGSLAMMADGRIVPDNAPYSISKTALNMLTVHQAYELRGRAIVVCIDPGHVKTTMGGPKALVEIPDSARGILGVLAGLKPEDSGKFLLYTGAQLDW